MTGRQQRQENREQTGRGTRVPLGTPRQKLSVAARPGYVRRWINDVGQRLAEAQRGGYAFVEEPGLVIGEANVMPESSDLGIRYVKSVSRSENTKAYLMEIKQEFYDEDFAAKQRKIDVIDETIKRGTVPDGTNAEDAGNLYAKVDYQPGGNS